MKMNSTVSAESGLVFDESGARKVRQRGKEGTASPMGRLKSDPNRRQGASKELRRLQLSERGTVFALRAAGTIYLTSCQQQCMGDPASACGLQVPDSQVLPCQPVPYSQVSFFLDGPAALGNAGGGRVGGLFGHAATGYAGELGFGQLGGFRGLDPGKR
jgi:hypothetical protein